MRILRWLVVVALVLVTTVVAVYVGRGLWVSSQVARAQDQAAADLTAGLPSGQAEAERDLGAVVRVAQAGEPSHVWRELVCEVDNQDAGMFLVDYYYQRCFIHSVAAIPAEGADPGNCESLPLPPRFRFSARVLVTTARPGDVDHCARRTIEDPRYVSSRASRLLEGTPATPSDLQASPYWVVAVVDTEVSKTELGCAPWKVLFCTLPVDAPTM